MLMSKTIRRSAHEQLDLFRPTPQRPSWKTLPKEIQQRIVQLLARLINLAHTRSGAAAKEVGDE
jgi:hypothetical protein